MNKIPSDSFHDSIRVSHCERQGPEAHKCIGTCKITPTGIELDCTLCGDMHIDYKKSHNFPKLQKILNHIGIEISYLHPQYIGLMLQEFES